ncbi:hypothetical protein [Rhizobium jaguaris]|uniref:Uncharacterized protein n=1 Tax=Rhizobium jaguaris TaxID=1312183 RepID=A0A387G3G5_9HYPH|nr:hypothetical protein CCGE525_37135 [Rhizobium jaguaris]
MPLMVGWRQLHCHVTSRRSDSNMPSLRQITSSGKGDMGKSATSQNRPGVLLVVGRKIDLGCDPESSSARPILYLKAEDSVLHPAAQDRTIWSSMVDIPGRSAPTTTSAVRLLDVWRPTGPLPKWSTMLSQPSTPIPT